jgi:hypothetical protein
MPQALAAAGIVTTVAGTAASASAASSQADYQAQVAMNNAQIARQNQGNALQAGAAAEQQQLFKTAGLVGAARAAGGSSGLDVNSGSQVNVRASDAALGNLGALTIRSNAARAAYGYTTDALADTTSAGNYERAGQQEVLGDALSGAGKIAGLAGQLQQSGALPGQSSPGITGSGGGGQIYGTPAGPGF